jgi:DNA adenine methylase
MLFLHAYEAERLFINDALPEICALYTAIKEDVAALTDKALLLAGKIVRALQTGSNDDAWSEFRSMRTSLSEWRVKGDSVSTEAAAWMLVLNRTAINGLHRVSRKGQCNMPFRKDLLEKAISGKVTAKSLVRPDHLREAHDLFIRTDATITQGDFADQEIYIEKGDYVFFDPPYDPCPKKVLEGKSAQSFTAYTADGFSDADHQRLADELDRIDDSGAFFTLTARATPTTRERYNKWHVHTISMRHNISPKNEGREAVQELLVTNIRTSVTLLTP